jgi:hypothetical protein
MSTSKNPVRIPLCIDMDEAVIAVGKRTGGPTLATKEVQNALTTLGRAFYYLWLSADHRTRDKLLEMEPSIEVHEK